MDIKDCKVGVKVKPKVDIGIIGASKGEELTIRKAEKDKTDGYKSYLYFEEKGSVGLSAEYFETVSKFEVGDKVVWLDDEVTIWGKHFEEENKEYEYAIENKEKSYRALACESQLTKFKKKDELEPGDKVIDFEGDKVEILCRTYDEQEKGIRYWVKGISRYKGGTWVTRPEDIDEIIYKEEK